MNEVRNILVGFDFGEKVSQLCYYDRREGEPVSLPVKVEPVSIPSPMCSARNREKRNGTSAWK